METLSAFQYQSARRFLLDYVGFVQRCLAGNLKSNDLPRGAIKSLAERLQCHPSFISQVFKKKADFSHEQAIRFCSYFQLSDDESEHFLNLLARDRAGDPSTKKHFQKRIERILLDRKSFQKRSKAQSFLSKEDEIIYFQTWVPPIVHAALQLNNHGSVEVLSKTTGVAKNAVLNALNVLARLKLAEKKEGLWHATRKSIHIGKDSPLNGAFHSHWRTKIASNLLEGKRTLENTHYSSIFSISEDCAEAVREIILKDLEKIREQMLHSTPTRLYALCVDFFPYI